MFAADAPGTRWPAVLQTLRSMQPRILYGLRMLGSVALAMWVAFWLQLENAYWAPLTAAIVCQPTIGASLRKGQFRIVGTFTGAVAIVVLTALMPQSRIGLIAGLIVWGMIAGVMATILRNSAAYAASLAGYTAVIVFSDAVNSSPNDVFTLAITRATEISIGVLSAGLVLSATDIGDARRRLAGQFAQLLSDIGTGLTETLRGGEDTVGKRRALIGKLAALDPLVDEALGETADLRYRSGMLKAGMDGMLRALAAWNDIDTHLSTPANRPAEVWPMPLLQGDERIDALDWHSDAAAARDRCRMLARRQLARPADGVTERLLLDRAAETLLGLATGGNAVALLLDPAHAEQDWTRRRIFVPDLFVALVNGLRVGFTMLLTTLIWIEFAWPGGQSLLVFSAVVTILFAPQADIAHKIMPEFSLGVVIATVAAAIVSFAVLPAQQTFLGLVLSIGVVMVPAAFMAAGTWHRFVFTAITFIFLALVGPSNQQAFEVASFMNGALAIVGGVLAGLLAFRLFPPVSPRWKSRRLLALTLRDVRRFAAGRRGEARQWLALLGARIGALPPGADPADRARLVAGLSAGRHLLRLRNSQAGLVAPERLRDAFQALAAGQMPSCIDTLRSLAVAQHDDPRGMRARMELVLLSDVLTRHQRFFADNAKAA